MPYDKTSLPAPPEFPASNASYNKLVGKMHKAALGATTAEAAIAAVLSIKDHIGGVNTYAKASRRYGDELVEFIGTDVADATQIGKAAAKGDPVAGFMLKGAKAQKVVEVETAKGKVKVDLAKLEVDPSKNPGGIKAGAKKPAKKVKRGVKA